MKKIRKPNTILYYILLELPTVILTVIFGVGYNVVFVFAPSFQGKLLDAVIGFMPLYKILVAALNFICIVLIVQISRYFKRFFVRRFANKTTRTMRRAMYFSTINLPLSELDSIEVGDLMTRCIGDVDITVEGIRKSITELLDTGVAALSYMIMMLFYTPKITLISCVFIFVAILLAFSLKSAIYKRNKSYRASESNLTSATYELTANASLFRNFGVTRQQIQKFDIVAEDVKNKALKATLLQNSLPPIYQVVASIGVVFVIFFGGKLTLDGAWTVGTFTAYLSLFLAFTIKASKISKLFNCVQKAKISWLRTKKYFHDNDNSIIDSSPFSRMQLSAQNLTFRYSPDGEQVFEPISFSAKPGDIIGITGKIASGKTTVLLALTALYGYGGSVTLDNNQLKDLPRPLLASVISYSGHNPFLLDDTIAENISVGRQCDVPALLNDVCFNIDLKNMQDGQNTIVGSNGVRLSGGQQARISLARALVGNNKIVLLDDPFSAVDQTTENQIIQNLVKNHSDKIFIIASHRPTIFCYATKTIDVISAQKNGETYTNGDEKNGGERL